MGIMPPYQILAVPLQSEPPMIDLVLRDRSVQIGGKQTKLLLLLTQAVAGELRTPTSAKAQWTGSPSFPKFRRS